MTKRELIKEFRELLSVFYRAYPLYSDEEADQIRFDISLLSEDSSFEKIKNEHDYVKDFLQRNGLI